MRQQDEPVALIYPPAAGELSVHVSRWQLEEWEKDIRPPLVMYRQQGNFHYLAPTAARLFAEALLKAADIAEAETPTPAKG